MNRPDDRFDRFEREARRTRRRIVTLGAAVVLIRAALAVAIIWLIVEIVLEVRSR